jgi:hypothetical protein
LTSITTFGIQPSDGNLVTTKIVLFSLHGSVLIVQTIILRTTFFHTSGYS